MTCLTSQTRNKLLAVILLSALSLGVGCPKKSLKQVANWGNTITNSMEEFEDLAIKFNQQGRISNDMTGTIIIQVLNINNSMQVAKNTVTRIQNRKKAGGEGMTEDERLALSDLFRVIRDTALDLEQIDVVGIGDDNARATLRAIISVVLTTLAEVTDMLAERGE
jgi:hypothetical protein